MVITGTGLGDVTAVTVGGHNATSFVVNRNTQITAQFPAHAYALDEHVVATNVTGSSTATAADHFDYFQDEISIERADGAGRSTCMGPSLDHRPG